MQTTLLGSISNNKAGNNVAASKRRKTLETQRKIEKQVEINILMNKIFYPVV